MSDTLLGSALEDVAAVFGAWWTVWTWHRRIAADGRSDTVPARLIEKADAAGAVATRHDELAITCRTAVVPNAAVA